MRMPLFDCFVRQFEKHHDARARNATRLSDPIEFLNTAQNLSSRDHKNRLQHRCTVRSYNKNEHALVEFNFVYILVTYCLKVEFKCA